eukprot:CAMPEP_0201283758 /NCGR_PEP_ID=MMETSP1317-20130820/46498_1 /ASSEMBLY_ACC=CAM_ASM_000770 /TAXON_ID=187299 /ORGANISM="Undescribed Undescribed, Strain Undescribed" /LENGTH=125 /DNA_ID=CAMNT_0047601241 /DNA_START=501 /DNA_END=878 /DNA_ORIENTATION=-
MPKQFTQWAEDTLRAKFKKVVVSSTLKHSAAVVKSDTSAGMRIMMKLMEEKGKFALDGTYTLELNAQAPLVVMLEQLYCKDEALAKLVLLQVADAALVQAGIGDPLETMCQRSNELLTSLLTLKL